MAGKSAQVRIDTSGGSVPIALSEYEVGGINYVYNKNITTDYTFTAYALTRRHFTVVVETTVDTDITIYAKTAAGVLYKLKEGISVNYLTWSGWLYVNSIQVEIKGTGVAGSKGQIMITGF